MKVMLICKALKSFISDKNLIAGKAEQGAKSKAFTARRPIGRANALRKAKNLEIYIIDKYDCTEEAHLLGKIYPMI